MLGLGDIQTLAVMIGCIAITAFGVVYGAVSWNRGSGE